MTLRKYWPIAIAFGAVLLYSWIDGDEPVPSKQTQQEDIAVRSPITGSFPATPSPQWNNRQPGYQTPAYTPPGQTGAFQAPYTSNYRFRTDEPIDNTSKRIPDPYGRPQQNRDYSHTMPVPGYQGYSGPDNIPLPDSNMTYRFRPQEGKKQPKRWEGNYVRKPKPRYQQQSPNPYDNQPPPTYQGRPATEHNPLWANSWPER